MYHHRQIDTACTFARVGEQQFGASMRSPGGTSIVSTREVNAQFQQTYRIDPQSMARTSFFGNVVVFAVAVSTRDEGGEYQRVTRCNLETPRWGHASANTAGLSAASIVGLARARRRSRLCQFT